MSKFYGHAQDVVRKTLLEQVEHLKTLIPDTEATRRNIAAIEKHKAPAEMPEHDLRNYVDLLARSAR